MTDYSALNEVFERMRRDMEPQRRTVERILARLDERRQGQPSNVARSEESK